LGHFGSLGELEHLLQRGGRSRRSSRLTPEGHARTVVAMVVGRGLKLVVVGGIAGLALSGAVTWVLQDYLYGVSTLDVDTFPGIPLILTAGAGVAAFIPARRASRVDPVRALRSE